MVILLPSLGICRPLHGAFFFFAPYSLFWPLLCRRIGSRRQNGNLGPPLSPGSSLADVLYVVMTLSLMSMPRTFSRIARPVTAHNYYVLRSSARSSSLAPHLRRCLSILPAFLVAELFLPPLVPVGL